MHVFVVVAEVIEGIVRGQVVQFVEAGDVEWCCITVVEVGIDLCNVSGMKTMQGRHGFAYPCWRCIAFVCIVRPVYA